MEIKPISTEAELEQFIQLPRHIYKNDPNWVQPLQSSVKKSLSPDNPFCKYGKFQGFLAWQNEQVVGRIVAAVNQSLIEREGQSVGLFGFFEVIEDLAVAEALLEAACQWLKEQGMTVARGPIDLSTHNNCLMLTEGFDSPPMVMMPYNPPYYPQFMDQLGWQKAKDAYAYNFTREMALDPKFEKGYRIACQSGITFRPMRTKGEGFEEDCRNLYQLFTTAFERNWSSSARSEEEFLAEAQDLKEVVDPDIFPIAEDNGKMIGFLMALPDLNIAFKRVNGKLNICGILKFLWYRRQINQVRILVICSLPEYRRKMVSLGLIHWVIQKGKGSRKGYQRAELSYVWEDNFPSRRLIEAAGAKICKRYRIYEKKLEQVGGNS
ncbi:GNAT family N-acetyltransferase [Spirulina subsalsa]|uniref:GNAT family N-acetyltransferase n=1 Tax=Spirulina subsalsa TaxID=54311 RepID=UPI00052779B5|nr:GNAT family N-acetyltransferase [Spirulina subsalsa]